MSTWFTCFVAVVTVFSAMVYGLYVRHIEKSRTNRSFSRTFWDIAPSSLRVPWWWRQHVPLKYQSTPMTLHDVISQKALILISAAMRTWNLTFQQGVESLTSGGENGDWWWGCSTTQKQNPKVSYKKFQTMRLEKSVKIEVKTMLYYCFDFK
jgi:hypothetical protein